MNRDTTPPVALTPTEALGPLNPVEAKHAPELLYLAGDRSLLRHAPRVSIVGTRKASAAGLERAWQLSETLAREGAVIVSGLAAGIDTAAHRAAIAAGGRTVAVLGTSLEQVYPRENRELQEIIAREHLVVSQFAPGTRTQPRHFPMRNRTMALVSDATVIVEAGEKSGTESQAWEAIRLGRPVFLLEELLEARLSWPRKLLDYGAYRVSKPEAVMNRLPTLAPDAAFAF